MKQENSVENTIHLRAVRYGAEYPNGFSYENIQHHYSKRLAEWEVVKAFLLAAKKNKEAGLNITTPFQVLKNRGSADHETDFTLSYEAAFNYLDFLELQQARENAKEAHRASTTAIWIAIASMIISGVLSFWGIHNSVRLDQRQYDKLIEKIGNR